MYDAVSITNDSVMLHFLLNFSSYFKFKWRAVGDEIEVGYDQTIRANSKARGKPD